jgi:manganese/zinc/iron transport system permease protein
MAARNTRHRFARRRTVNFPIEHAVTAPDKRLAPLPARRDPRGDYALGAVVVALFATGAWLVARLPAPGLSWWTVAIAAACSSTCGLVGCYLVLRKMSLLGDAISHAVLPGIALAFFFSGQITGVPIFLGAMALGVLTTLFTQALRDYGNVPEDSGMGVVYTALFAAGVIMVQIGARQVDLDPGCVLYGMLDMAALNKTHVFGVAVPRSIVTLGIALVATLAFILTFWKELKIASFDAGLATAMGFRAMLIHYLLMGVVAGVTVASFEAVGSILVVAMLIVPGATAHLLTDRLGWMLVWSVVVSLLTSLFGYALSRALNVNVAGTMAVVAGLQFALAVFFAPRHGLFVKWVSSARLSLRIVGEDIVARLYRAEEAAANTGSVTTPAAANVMEAEPTRWRRWRRSWATANLVNDGLIRRTTDGDLLLTAAGRQAGRSIVRAHRLWESYLERHFELPLDHVHEPAERMEHYLGPELQTQLAEQLAEPAQDPHGRAIPPS